MIIYDWTDVQEGVNALGGTIEKMLRSNEQSISSIVGVSRGGLVPAVMLSHRLNACLEPLKWQTRDQDQDIDVDTLLQALSKCKEGEILLVVDEIVDSGKTFSSIKSMVTYFNKYSPFPVEVVYCAIVQRMSCLSEMVVLSAKVIDSDDWVVFPWEIS